MVEMKEQTDLDLVDNYIERCQQFVNPFLLRQVTNRGLYHVINFLPHDIKEAKAVARARLIKMGKFFDEPEIDAIFQEINRLEFLKNELNKIKITDVDKLIPILGEMSQRSLYVRDYFKEVKIP